MTGERPQGADGRVPFLPRRMELEALIRTLVAEHATMKEGLSVARAASAKRDFEELAGALRRLDPLFRQHIVDEEATILRSLVERLGVEGAQEEIRVFQQHRPIYRLMERVAEFASLSASELEARQEELRDLFDRHALAEEALVFPKARSLSTG